MTWILFEFFCYFCVWGIPISVQYGWKGWALQTTFGYLSTIIDWYAFPHFKKNMAKLNQHGYANWQVWSIMLFNLCATNALVAFIYMHCLEDLAPFSIKTVGQVFINMAITELLFTSSHALQALESMLSQLQV